MENIIEIQHLYKSFGEVKAVQDISFRVKTGELFAFLGLNGAGKSTTISIICGQLKKDSGKVFVCDCDNDVNVDAIKKNVGVVFQNSVLDKSLSVLENLKIRATLYGIYGKAFLDRLDQLNKMLDLNPLYKRTVGKLSGGERRRLDIARALLHNPQILILDEPTTGLDPQTRKMVWSVIDDLRVNHGVTVFLTTHYMEEAVDADYVVILDAGKIVAEGTPHDLKNQYAYDYITIYEPDIKQVEKMGLKYQSLPDSVRIQIPNTQYATDYIVKYPDIFKDYEITKGKMDDVFIAATGKRFVEEQK